MEVSAEAKLQIAPKGTQVAVITLFLFSAFFFGASVWLDYIDKPYVLSLGGALVFLALGSVGWWGSHKNESLAKSHPFEINMGEGENSVSFTSDARSLPEVSYVKNVLSHWSALIHRRPLPEADGLIDAGGSPVFDSKGQAKHVTDAANSVAKQQVDDAIQLLAERAALSPYEPTSPVVSVVDQPKSGA